MSQNVIQGDFLNSRAKVAIVVTRWNSFITERLKEGAIDTLKRHGISEAAIEVVYCPGAFEIPLTAKTILQERNVDGVICLGAVIRGSTPHFDYVCSAVTSGVAQLNLEFGKPLIFGVLTTDTIEQAIERAGTKAGNKGEEAATAFMEMSSLMQKLHSDK
jgi:6,7-dimethyl-8-ribityllumazine synthase